MNHPPIFQFPIICSNNTMIKVSLLQMKQSDKYGSERNDRIFNLHLGSGAGTSVVSIPCLLQDTSHIHRFYLPNQSSKKRQIYEKRSSSQPIVLFCLGLPTHNPELREVGFECNPKRGSNKINRLKPRRKNTTEKKSYCTAWTYKREPSI